MHGSFLRILQLEILLKLDLKLVGDALLAWIGRGVVPAESLLQVGWRSLSQRSLLSEDDLLPSGSIAKQVVDLRMTEFTGAQLSVPYLTVRVRGAWLLFTLCYTLHCTTRSWRSSVLLESFD